MSDGWRDWREIYRVNEKVEEAIAWDSVYELKCYYQNSCVDVGQSAQVCSRNTTFVWVKQSCLNTSC